MICRYSPLDPGEAPFFDQGRKETIGHRRFDDCAGRLLSRNFVGRADFGKISAVEGIQMTAAMKKRADDARVKGLTAEEYRRTIIRSHSKG